MTINTVPVSSDVRTPRAIIKINDTSVTFKTGLLSLQWDQNTYFQADTFSAKLVASALPSGIDADYLSDTVKIPVEIYTGFPDDPDDYTASDLDSMFYGMVDTVQYDLATGVFVISGRDLTAELIDKKTDEKYPNSTASTIVKKIASAQGLTADVTTTTTLVGRYYNASHTQLADNQTLWDLICYLAQMEGFIAYVDHKTLHFTEPPDSDSDPYLFQWTSADESESGLPVGNFSDMSFSRAITVAKDITVKVRSYDSRQNASYSASATVTHNNSSGMKISYTYNIPGLTYAQALASAKRIAKDLAKHERKVTVRGPADNDLDITNMAQVDGTNTAWDQTYFVDSITREISLRNGYVWTVAMKNMSPASISTTATSS